MNSGQYPVENWCRKEDLKELKIQKLPWGSLPLDPLEACAFGARLGNQSVFILDPRLTIWQNYLSKCNNTEFNKG